ncbi:MAG: HTH-type transcriptional repressor Bm3R1 [Syntrophomonadaceae bacterium]|nr:HTH-type transcriptional repressor Bm3R1 [Bacillota bacterium]
MKSGRGMTISELEQKSGFQRSTIHYYIQAGLLPQPYKSGQTMAYYDKNHLRRLEEIQRIKVNYLKSSKRSRVPLEIIKRSVSEGYAGIFHNHAESKNPAANKTNKRKLRKKEEIIEAALKLYSSRGFYRTSIRDIAKEANITAPTFYHYFSDKRKLFVEAIEYVIHEFKRDLTPILKNEKDLTKRTFLRFNAFYDNYPRIGEILNQLRAGVAINDQWAKEKLRQVYDELMKEASEGIRNSIKLGHIRNIDPDLLTFFFVTLDEAVINWASMNENKYTLKKITFFLADFLYNGFLTPKGKESWQPQFDKDYGLGP